MRDGFAGNQSAQTRQAKVLPGALALDPVQRGLPPLFLFERPAFGEPKFWALVPIVFDKCPKFLIVHQSRSNFVRVQQDFVPGALIVEAKVQARVPNALNPLGAGVPVQGRHFARLSSGQITSIGGVERILGKQMENIGQDQLLMLLFVVDPKFNDTQLVEAERSRLQALENRLVHRSPIFEHSR